MKPFIKFITEEYTTKRYTPNMELSGQDIMGDKKKLILNLNNHTLTYDAKTEEISYAIKQKSVDKEEFNTNISGRKLSRSFKDLKPNYIQFVKLPIEDANRPRESFLYHRDYSK